MCSKSSSNENNILRPWICKVFYVTKPIILQMAFPPFPIGNFLPVPPMAILPDMFGINGDLLFVIIIIFVMIALGALFVKYLTKATELQIRLERELRTTRNQEMRLRASEEEVKQLKKREETYKDTQASMLNLYASPAYGQTEKTLGDYGDVEVYQHYEQIPSETISSREVDTEPEEPTGPVTRAAVATAVATSGPLRERGDFLIQDVFVIYRDGRLVTHLSKKVRIIDDSEIIGSMITAVQTFVRESFRRESKGTLEEMKFGDIRILMEYGPALNIALVIRGTKYEAIRPVMKDILDNLHSEWLSELSTNKWDGNLANIVALEKVIQRDLLDRFETETFHRSDTKSLDLSKAKVFHPDE
jgi:hypothetical protein